MLYLSSYPTPIAVSIFVHVATSFLLRTCCYYHLTFFIRRLIFGIIHFSSSFLFGCASTWLNDFPQFLFATELFTDYDLRKEKENFFLCFVLTIKLWSANTGHCVDFFSFSCLSYNRYLERITYLLNITSEQNTSMFIYLYFFVYKYLSPYPDLH